MKIFNRSNNYTENYELLGKKAFAKSWRYFKPVISNVSTRLRDPERLKGLDSFTYLNDVCNKHFQKNLRTVLTQLILILERKNSEFAPGHFNVIDGDCRLQGFENHVVFFPENSELQISLISITTNCSPLMIQLIDNSPILSVYYSEEGVEKSIAIDGSNV